MKAQHHQSLGSLRCLLNVGNGSLDLRTGDLREHRPDDLLTQAINVDFDVDALAPTWDAFLLKSLGDDPSLVGYVRRAVGLTLASDMSVPALFVLHGPTASGKSTFLEVLVNALGDYAIATNAHEVLLRRRSERATEPHLVKLRAARFVVASETSADAGLDEAKIKSLTGGDTISARTVFQEPIEFRPRFHIWLATNQLPRIREVDDAIYRRIKVIPFEFSVAPEERDPKLRERQPPRSLGSSPGQSAARMRPGMWASVAIRGSTSRSRATERTWM